MGIRDAKIKYILATGFVMDNLAKLGRELEDEIRFVIIKVSKKEESRTLVLHFQEMEICSNVVIENSFIF